MTTESGAGVNRDHERLQDEIWVLEYRGGDAGALEKLIRHWQARIYAYCLTVLGEVNAALDASQEVWLGAIKGLGRRRPPENFPAWIYTIARNVTISVLRRKTRVERRQHALPEQVKSDEISLLDEVTACEDAELVRESITELPLAQREALTLFYLEQMSLEEIAQVLRVPKGTVQSRLHYGRMKVKEALIKKGYCDAGG